MVLFSLYRLRGRCSAITLVLLLLSGNLFGQTQEQEDLQRKSASVAIPEVFDFSELFNQEKMTREAFEQRKIQREARLRDRFSRLEALEGAVDPQTYVVGPGDEFLFNLWGPGEIQIPLTVSPEGVLLVPSVGEIHVAGKPLSEVKIQVLERATSIYNHTEVGLTLEAMRLFRVHVTGEVQYPGTYLAQADHRVSEMIVEAGGVTDRAWRNHVALRRASGDTFFVDLDAFVSRGDLANDFFVNGGDVIHVLSVENADHLVHVQGDLESAGAYAIIDGEDLLAFLRRIRALKRNTDLSSITVRRTEETLHQQSMQPFASGNPEKNTSFLLRHGDQILLPSPYVYVRGAVRNPGAYPFALNLTARDYAGMAGGDYRSGSIRGVKVFHAATGKTVKGPDTIVQMGDMVSVPQSWGERFRDYLTVVSTITSLILAAKAVGVFGN